MKSDHNVEKLTTDTFISDGIPTAEEADAIEAAIRSARSVDWMKALSRFSKQQSDNRDARPIPIIDMPRPAVAPHRAGDYPPVIHELIRAAIAAVAREANPGLKASPHEFGRVVARRLLGGTQRPSTPADLPFWLRHGRTRL